MTLSVRRPSDDDNDKEHGREDDHDTWAGHEDRDSREARFSPATRVAIPAEIELSEGSPKKTYRVELSFDDITCTYENRRSSLVARLVSCSDSSLAGRVVSAREISLKLTGPEDAPIRATVTLTEEQPCGNRDGGTDAGRSDAGADAAPDASSVDAGTPDATVDSGPSCDPATCDDSNPCTTDSCSQGACSHAPVSAGTSCSDGNPCNGLETCNGAGACQAGTPPQVDDGNPCTVDSCDPSTGVVHVPAAAGTTCSDSNA